MSTASGSPVAVLEQSMSFPMIVFKALGHKKDRLTTLVLKGSLILRRTFYFFSGNAVIRDRLAWVIKISQKSA